MKAKPKGDKENMIKTPFPSQATRIRVDMEVKDKGDRKHIPNDTKAKP